jgi:hypothetical protein
MLIDESDGREYAQLVWRTASASGGGDCVQVARTEAGIAVRDSKNPAGPWHAYERGSWSVFLARVKSGGFDHLVT